MTLDICDFTILENKIGYSFLDKKLLAEALFHPSIKQIRNSNSVKNYERFELLGDAILSFVILELLLEKFPDYTEGNISKIKSYLVSKDVLYQVGAEIDIKSHIVMSPGEENSGGRYNINNIANVVEALIAAIYMDNHSILDVSLFIKKLWYEFLNNIDFKKLDPKTKLQEWSQDNRYGLPHYNVIRKVGLMHSPIFTIEVTVGPHKQTASGHSTKIAEKNAADLLLIKLNNLGS
ncbi:ribonuclease III [Rickettsia endosymbiont of Cardiosporidium cionae]|uniref:ribonuclease III n=1 Tax=Rickettsia endosymbiont of Cardiosporidium cionae TaxID=2777155 RepID=UPI001893B7D3|nr:ribonuclease III [Rickettsia endosymbiont of Cardiosporidium cionae]KAF8818817.1 ribonuclease III [Rickettsia endosymbiont of Cardiosporidium cionae]